MRLREKSAALKDAIKIGTKNCQTFDSFFCRAYTQKEDKSTAK